MTTARRPQDLGIRIGRLQPGPHNAITDVAGIRVGHTTVVTDSPAAVRSGVTAVVPGDIAGLFEQPMAAGVAALNGAGELTGSWTIREWGTLETPVLLCPTMSVGRAYQAVIEELFVAMPDLGVDDVAIPVVGECDDSWLSDPAAMGVTVEHCRAAIRDAAEGAMESGTVGGGTGMLCLGWKGGIGNASRQVQGHTVGVLVMTNFGSLQRLCIAGVAVGEQFAAAGRRGWRDEPEGSCIVVIATDAPLLPRQCERLAGRAGLGLARTGSIGTHGSGEIFLAFSTTGRFDRHRRDAARHDVLGDRQLDALFEAVVDCTEEAVLDSLFCATAVTGRNARVAEALPVDEVLAMLAPSLKSRPTQ